YGATEISSFCNAQSCEAMLYDHLVTGATITESTNGQVIYVLPGQPGTTAFYKFDGLPDGVRPAFFIAGDDNKYGETSGTVMALLYQGGGKGPAQVLNIENPLKPLVDKPNRAEVVVTDKGLTMTTFDANGQVLEDGIQEVPFLPPLPELPQGTGEIQFVDGGYHYLNVELDKNVVVKIVESITTDGETQRWITPADHPDWPLFIENEDGSWREAMVYVEVTKRVLDENGKESPFLGEDLIIDLGGSNFLYAVMSPVIAGKTYLGQEGYLRVPVAVPFDGNPESPMVRFNLVLGHPESGVVVSNPFSGKNESFTRAEAAEILKAGVQMRVMTRSDLKYKKEWEILWNSIKSLYSQETQDYYDLSMENLWQNTIIIKALRDGEFVDAEFKGLEIWSVETIELDF
ncbi:MAG: hypothetical protein KKH28_05335, partial [Elusimicrobia bacterium]|nr:hypothetical protein [Elusimicrobiota bacterium]